MHTQTKELTNTEIFTLKQVIIRQLLVQNDQAFSSFVPTKKNYWKACCTTTTWNPSAYSLL